MCQGSGGCWDEGLIEIKLLAEGEDGGSGEWLKLIFESEERGEVLVLSAADS